VLQTIGTRLENYDCDSAASKVLLKAEIRIHGNQDIKAASASLKSSPFCFPDQPAS